MEDPSASVDAATAELQSLLDVERAKRKKTLDAWPAQFSQTAPWRNEPNKFRRVGEQTKVKHEVKEEVDEEVAVVRDVRQEDFQEKVTEDVEKLRRQILDEHDEFVILSRMKGVEAQKKMVERSQHFMENVVKKNVKKEVQEVQEVEKKARPVVKKEVQKVEKKVEQNVKRRLQVVDVDPKRVDPKWKHLKAQPKWLAPRQPLSKSKASPGAVKMRGTVAPDAGLGVNINL